MLRLLPVIVALLLGLLPATARAEIEVGFWTREMGLELPHAFFTINGTVAGKPVEETYGFTAKAITPALLWGPVPGRIDIASKGYMAASHKLYTVTLPDEAYAKLKAVVARYSAKPGSIYRMNERNCVHFTAEAAAAIGMRLPDGKGMMKRPTSYMMAVAAANRDFPTLKMLAQPKAPAK
jgi:hypothetical protein